MSDDHHTWRLGSEPPLIRPHSIAKHRVIKQYLSRYIDVLTADPRIPEFHLTLVDGFAGGGLYRDERTKEERSGSPLLMLEAMQESEVRAQCKRSKIFNLDVNYIFVESSKEAFPYLRTTLEKSQFRNLLSEKITLINGVFVNQVTPIINHIKARGRGHRAIFVLDQFGYAAVPFREIRAILSQLENAEIILTFATDSLIDYLSSQDSTQKRLETLGLKLDKAEIHTAKQQTGWRREIQHKLYRQVHVNSDAKFYTPFFIRSKDAHRDFWLIHLSNHSRARDVMVGLHWLENTSFEHFGRSGLFMLGYNQDYDIKVSGQQDLFPEFRFDEIARATTHECLMDELPKRLFRFTDGIAFGDFFSQLTNETPATSDIMKMALAVLLKEGEIEIRDKDKLIRRQAGVQRHTDIIVPSRQRRFLFGS